ncbi:hypothetical protein ACFQV8_36555 [Pseudonocardia benzenivorans]
MLRSDPGPRTAPAVGSVTSDEPLPGRWLVFGIVGLALLLGSIDQTSVATALPTMQADLGGSSAGSAGRSRSTRSARSSRCPSRDGSATSSAGAPSS